MNDNHSLHDEQTKKTITYNIDKYGCHLALIEADNYLPAFVYSIGLFKNYNHPEIILFGLKTDVMASVINAVKDSIKEGEKFEQYKSYSDFLQDFDIQFIPVDKSYYPNYLGYAGWFYGNFDFPVLQLIWPDKQSKFPWDSDFNIDWKFKQPLLDRNTDFKFYEERNLGIYTTKQIFEGYPIKYVYHNEDGAWQFHTSLNPNIDDAKLISLEEIIKIDSTINDIYHLPLGWRAWRDDSLAEWQYQEDDEKDE